MEAENSSTVPQFILDSLIKSHEGSGASILVTQPRRLSAIGVAKRVSAERLDDGSVGYAIRGESNWSQKTKMLFCTTGVVLRRLSLGDRLEDVTHIVVDEVCNPVSQHTTWSHCLRFTSALLMATFFFWS